LAFIFSPPIKAPYSANTARISLIINDIMMLEIELYAPPPFPLSRARTHMKNGEEFFSAQLTINP